MSCLCSETCCRQHFISTAANECQNHSWTTDSVVKIWDVNCFKQPIGGWHCMCGDFLAIVQKTILCNHDRTCKKQPNTTKQTNRICCEFFNILKLVVEISLCLKYLSCSFKIPKQNKNTNRMAMKCRNPTNKQCNQAASTLTEPQCRSYHKPVARSIAILGIWWCQNNKND